MTPEQIELVEDTLRAVRSRLDEVTVEFYERLFAADPAVAELFTSDPAEQRAKLRDSLEEIVLSIRRHDEFLVRAGGLGARHVEYGVRAGHYGVAGAALLAAMGVALGDRWTPDVEQAWRLAYNLTAEVMLSPPPAG